MIDYLYIAPLTRMNPLLPPRRRNIITKKYISIITQINYYT